MPVQLVALNSLLRLQSRVPFEIGVGIDSGEVVAGLIGPDSRVEYGMGGDPINLANRVESRTKELRATVLVSKGIADQLGPAFVRGRTATMPVKGKKGLVEVVEVLEYRT